MARPPLLRGVLVAILAAASFGSSGPFVTPLLHAGWSPAAAVAVRAAIGGVALAPFAAVTMRRGLRPLWAARWRVLAMAVLGVAATQVLYFSAIERIPVSTAILVEYMAPIVLVLVSWITLRRRPQTVVLIGSAVALLGLVLVVSPRGGGLDAVGLLLALGATGCLAVYFVVAAHPSEGVSPVAFASAALLTGALLVAAVGALGLVPLSASTRDVALFGERMPWWVPMLVIGLVATAVAYASSIGSSMLLGSRLASFMGLLEVVAAASYAWLLLGQGLGPAQFAGGALVILGIIVVDAGRRTDPGDLPRAGRPARRRDPASDRTGAW